MVTATKAIRKAVCNTLGMVSPAVVPNRPNIKYVVQSNPSILEETFSPLVEELRRQHMKMEQAIIYGHTYDSCSMIYLYFNNLNLYCKRR